MKNESERVNPALHVRFTLPPFQESRGRSTEHGMYLAVLIMFYVPGALEEGCSYRIVSIRVNNFDYFGLH